MKMGVRIATKKMQNSTRYKALESGSKDILRECNDISNAHCEIICYKWSHF